MEPYLSAHYWVIFAVNTSPSLAAGHETADSVIFCPVRMRSIFSLVDRSTSQRNLSTLGGFKGVLLSFSPLTLRSPFEENHLSTFGRLRFRPI